MGHILDYRYIVISILLFVAADPGAAQEPATRSIGLEEAVAEALARNGDLKAARARADAERARGRAASAFLYPTLGVEAGSVRSDDPVAVFGTRLRQERFGQADFDIESLNRPDPVTDWAAGGGVAWKILDPAAWSGREAARLGVRASELGLERNRQATVFRTRVLYLGALAAEARLDAAQRGLEASRASRDVVRDRVEQGMLTDADVLEAEAEVATARARESDASLGRYEARSRLGAHLGWSPDTLPRPRGGLLRDDPPFRVAPFPDGPERVANRADLRALDRASAAADARVSQAVRSRIPSVETFARVSTHAWELTGDRAANWTLGVQLRWPVFTGFARESAVDEARAMRRAVEVEHGQRLREAQAELEEARRAVQAARAGAEAAEAAASAAREARRLVRRRFQEGLATTARLLRADARTAAMEARAIDARTALHMAAARLDFVLGVPSDSPGGPDQP